MRILLKKGYQRKLIELAKNGITWKTFAKKMTFSESHLRNGLRKEEVSIDEKLYEKLCAVTRKNFDEFIIKKMEDNWGRSKGGKNSGSFRKPKLLVTKPSKQLAELIGIILGDGNIYVGRGGYYYVRICGDNVKDRNYLLNYVRPLFELLFHKKMHIVEQIKYHELFISIGNKDIVHTLVHFGLKAGNKMKNNVQIPSWIFKSKEYIQACVRGLIDTDGSVCPITGRNYPYIWFSCDIENLRKGFDRAMKILEIKTSKWNMRKDRTPDIYIGSKEMIQKYIQTISFKNDRHLSKIGKYAPMI